MLVVAGAGNQLQTCFTPGRRRMGPEKSLCALPQHPILCQLGRDPPRAHLRKGTNLASGNCIRDRETFLGKPSSPTMSVCSGMHRFPVSPLSLFALGPRRVWAVSTSLGTGALQVIVRAGNQLQTCSHLGRKRMGPVKSLCALAPEPHIPQVTEGNT